MADNSPRRRNLRHDDQMTAAEHASGCRSARRPLVWVVALAAVSVAGCSSSPDPTPVPTITVTATTPASAPTSAPGAPETTVTVTPPATTTTVAQQSQATGPFTSPSGNIHCTMFTGTDGQSTARCEVVVDHSWVAPPRSPNCQLAWGDRLEVSEGSAGTFSCYGQDLPPAQGVLAYGQTRSVGSLTCASEPSGMTCTDGSTGHYFRISRESYQLG